MNRRVRAVIHSVATVAVVAVFPSLSLAADVVASCPSSPVGEYGSRLVLTIRDCTGRLATENCTSANPPIESYSESCLDTEVSNSISVIGFGSTEGAVTYNGPAALPNVSQGAFPSSNSRNGTTMESWQEYVYNGTEPSILPISADFSFNASADQSPGPNTAFLFAGIAVLDGNLIDVNDVMNNVRGFFFPSCGDEAFYGLPAGSILSVDAFLGPGPGGTVSLDASTRCDDGSTIVVDPGDSFIVTTSNQAIADRGGIADATNTLKVGFSPDTPPEVLIQLVDNIEPGCENCGPEQVQVAMEAFPDGEGHCVRGDGPGLIPLEIYGSESIDVSQIRIDESLQLGSLDMDVNAVLKKCDIALINDDSMPDLVCQFPYDNSASLETPVAGRDEFIIDLLLRGKLFDGTPIEGVSDECARL